jgi:hypothetical protein
VPESKRAATTPDSFIARTADADVLAWLNIKMTGSTTEFTLLERFCVEVWHGHD